MTLALFGEAVDHRQAKTGTLPQGLGGEERLDARSITSGGMPAPVSVMQIATYCPGVTSRWLAA
jgi:hypothetical protein